MRPAVAKAHAPSVVGARTELRRQMQTQPGPVVALVVVVVVLLGVLPLYLVVRATTTDPVFASLNTLQVPAWSAADKTDRADGSQWCIIDCRFRERDLVSERPADETAGVYQDALRAAGWQPWKVDQCPVGSTPGRYSCWTRDEYTLDLWVREPPCPTEEPLQAAVEPSESAGASETATPTDCTGSVVSIKVRNRVDDERGRGTEPDVDPSLVGETPDSVYNPATSSPSPVD